jgi:hypothetical protein
MASRMLENPEFFDQFFKIAEQNGRLEKFKAQAMDDMEDGEDKTPADPVSPQPKTNSNRLTSQTNLGNQAEKSLKELTSSLLSKSKTEIKFKELNKREISSWGDAVEAYERVHSDWDRNQIERSLRRRINSRWTLEAYQSLLPENLQSELHRVSDNTWMDPDVVTTIDLVRFLIRTCGVGQGTTNLHAGYEELLDLVRNYSLPMRKGTISKGFEDFFMEVEDLMEAIGSDPFSLHEEKELSKALHATVLKSRRDGADEPILDVAVGRAVLEEMKNDPKNSFNRSMALLRNGQSKAIREVVGNFLFDNVNSKGDGKARSKYPQNPNSQRDFPAPDRKKSRQGTPTPDKHDKTAPVCNGCGRWISDKHKQETCEYIVRRLPGYNKSWETIGWDRSDAHRAVMDKVHLTKPDHKGPFYLAPPKPQGTKDPSTKGTVCCNTLSYSNSNTLPLIQGILMAKPRTEEKMEKEVEENMESHPTMGLLHKNNFENKGSQRLRNNLITIFIDTGSGDNFVSTLYAESLIKYGYTPNLKTTMCEVCSPFTEMCVPCGQTYSLDIVIKDDNGENINLQVVSKTLPIKHDLIIGLRDIRQNNLMWRFPKIFLSKDFNGYLEGNLLWSYLRAMLKEHLSRRTHESLQVSKRGPKRVDRTAEEWVSSLNATVELAPSDSPLRKQEERTESSLDPGQSPEQSSMQDLPHGNSQSELSLNNEIDKQSLSTGPVRKKKKLRKTSFKEKDRRSQSDPQGHSGRKAQSGSGTLQSNTLRWECRRRIGVKWRKVKIKHLAAISKGDTPDRTNFSTTSPFEADGLQDLKDSDLEAIPTDMLRTIDPNAAPELPDLRHLQDDAQSAKLFRDLCEEYADLFRATVSSTEAQVKPFSLKVDQEKWETRGNRSPPRR